MTISTSTTAGGPPSRTYYSHVNVTALKTADGGRRWTYAFPVVRGTYGLVLPALSTVGGPVAVQNGRVLSNYSLSSVMLNSGGNKVWSVTGSVATLFATFVGDGTPYVMDNAGWFRTLDPTTGADRLRLAIGNTATDAPVVADDGTVYVTLSTGKVVKVR